LFGAYVEKWRVGRSVGENVHLAIFALAINSISLDAVSATTPQNRRYAATVVVGWGDEAIDRLATLVSDRK
jgi:hypothetical protein